MALLGPTSQRAARRAAAIGRHVHVTPNQASGAFPGAPKQGQGRVLEGVKILELATVVAAPSACAILADMGADVLKVENPDAPDYPRSWAIRDDPGKTADPEHRTHGVGSSFTQFNRGKRAIALNYTKPEGLRVLKKMMGECDVFVTNVRLKALKKIGLDYESVAGEFPKMIYAHLSAWGLTGPRQDDPGYDVGAFYAYTGLMELSRSSDAAPLPRPAAGFGDHLTGTQLVAGIALALLHRHTTGKGQLVDVALLRAGIWSMAHPLVSHAAGNNFAAGETPALRTTTELGERKTMITDGSFRCKDGRWIMLLGIESNRHWEKTVKALGLTGTFSTDWKVARKTDWKEATLIVDKVMAEKTYDEWHEIFEAADIWHTPINRYEDVMADPHANAAGSFAEVPGMQHKLVANPIQLSSQKGIDGPAGRAPTFGEHTAPVLRGLGYTPEEIARLTREGVVKTEEK